MPIEFPPDAKFVLEGPPRLERYQNAHATAYERDGNTIRGALYDEAGALINLSQRVSGRGGDIISLGDPPSVAAPDAKKIAGRGCYIGHIYNHYGHFITEGLSSLWAGADFDYYVAHPFIFGGLIPEYARQIMKKLGFDLGKLHALRSPAVFEDITVPERAWRLNDSVFSTFREVAGRIAVPFDPERVKRRIYLSRSNIALRAVSNEIAIEEMFSKRGFMIVHPERLTIDAQLSLYAQAEIIAGFGGSALHNLIFCPPGTRTIILGDERAQAKPLLNQAICAALKNSRTTMIPYRATPAGFDLGYLAKSLDQAI